MNANSINLQKVFEATIRYRIPLFQRPYVWDEENNWTYLWEDVRNLAERHLRNGDVAPHFLGAIVLDQLRSQVGSIEVRQVIDGQQRLVTLQLLLSALRDLSQAHEVDRYASRFAKLTTNDEAFVDQPDEAFKVWPTNRDRDDYRKTLTAGSDGEIRRCYDARSSAKRVGVRIPDGYLYFHRMLSDWLTKNGEDEDGEPPLEASLGERLDALWSVVRGRLLLVAIDLDDDDDAQVIFETLNARGTQLLPADLVKNYLFHMAEVAGAPIEQLYKEHWERFDEDFWRQEIRQGRLKRPRIDIFLQHYLTLKTNDDVNVGHIFGVFKFYVDHSTKPTGGDEDEVAKETAEDHLMRLAEYGDVFSRFYKPAEGSRAELFFQRLEAIDTATVFPFLLEAFKTLSGPENEERLAAILVDLESYLTRRMICGLTMKNYNRLFLDLVRDAEKAGGVSPEAVQGFLLRQQGDSGRWPNDEEFRNALLSVPFYNWMNQTKQRMVLQALDAALEDSKTEEVQYPSKLSIEHLMPQKWHEHWLLPLDNPDNLEERQEKDELRGKLLHTVGNLTLVTSAFNSALSNLSWADKRPEILRHSKLNLNRYFQDVEVWNEEAIVRRARDLFDVAKQTWPCPVTES